MEINNKIFLPILIVSVGVVVGLFIHPFTQFPMKFAVVFLFAIGFSFLMLVTHFSRRIIYLGLCVAFILYLDFYLVHVDHAGIVHGISMSVIDFLIIILLLRRGLYSHEYPNIKSDKNTWKQGIGVSIFLVIAFSLSIINSKYPILTLFALVHYLKLLLFLLIVAYDIMNENELLDIMGYLTIALFVINIYCLMQYMTKTNITVGFNVFEEPIWYKGPFVPVGPSGSANVTAGQIIGLTPFALATALRHPKSIYRLSAMLILLLSIVVLILTNSRASWGIFLMSSVLMLVLLTMKKKISYKYILAVGIVTVISCITVIPLVLQKVDIHELTDLQNIYARFNLLETSFMMVKDYPVLGIGLNTYTKLMMDYVPSIVLKFEWNYMVHNKYMLVWSETGTLGFIAYLTFLIVMYKLLIGYIKKYNNELIWVAIAILSSLFSMNFHMMFESYSGGAVIAFFWLLCGCIIAMNRLATSPN